MDKQGIDMSIVCNIGWTEHALCVESNDYLLEAIALYPGRLAGLAAIQPKAGEAAVQELERCVKGGISGIGEMRPDLQGFDILDEKLLTPLVKVLTRNQLFWLSHTSEPVGHDYPGKGALTPQVIYPFILRYPELHIVLAHWGGGLLFYALMPEVKNALHNVSFDTAASPYLYQPQIYKQAMDIMGAEHILFGSDYPLMSTSRPLEEIKTLGLSGTDTELLLGRNAARLLKL
jgi:predicted TIM-barrel fold metal-dependent hydrolase